MQYLEIASVVAGPKLNLAGADGASSYTIYSGVVSLARSNSFRGIVRPDDRQPIAFFVPDSAAYPTDPASLAVETSLRRILTLGNPSIVVFGAYDEAVSVAADPRGGEHRWLQVSLQVPMSSISALDLNYRVTVSA